MMTDQKRAEDAAREWVNANHPTKDCNMRMAFISGVRWRDEQEDSDMTTAYLVGHAKATDDSARRIKELEAELALARSAIETKYGKTDHHAHVWQQRDTLRIELSASQAREERLEEALSQAADGCRNMSRCATYNDAVTEFCSSCQGLVALADHAKAKGEP